MRKKKKQYYYYTVHQRAYNTYISITKFDYGIRKHISMLPPAEDLLKLDKEFHFLPGNNSHANELNDVSDENTTINRANNPVEQINADSVEQSTQEKIIITP